MSASAGTLTPARRPVHWDRFAWRFAFYAFVIVVTVITVFPIYWMLLTAVQPTQFSLKYPPYFVPGSIDLSAFNAVFSQYPVSSWLWHSAQIAVLATAICLTLSVLGAYPLSCLQWRGRSVFGFFLFFTQMMPETMIVIPIFITYRRLHFVEHIWPLALIDAAFVIPVGVWILKNVFDGIPGEIREAALVDGCGLFGVLWRIVLPLAGPGLVAVAVVAYFYGWNDYLFASTMITNQDILPASVGLASFITMSDV